jgi:transcriptional regulator with XRE-family HTH domain
MGFRHMRKVPTTQIFIERILANLDQTRVAADIGVSQSFLSQVECGRFSARPKIQQKLAEMFKKSVSQLFEPDGYAKLHESK